MRSWGGGSRGGGVWFGRQEGMGGRRDVVLAVRTWILVG